MSRHSFPAPHMHAINNGFPMLGTLTQPGLTPVIGDGGWHVGRSVLASPYVGHTSLLIGGAECSSGGISLRRANDLHTYADLRRAQFPTSDWILVRVGAESIRAIYGN